MATIDNGERPLSNSAYQIARRPGKQRSVMISTRRHRGAAVWLAALCAGAAWGCGESGEKFVPVAGTVTLDGQPLPAGSVSFQPDASKGNTSLHIPIGQIDAQGRYEVVTVGRKGAPPGWYKVLVFYTENDQPGDDPNRPHVARPRSLIHTKYNAADTTTLFVEVVENPRPGDYNLNVSR